MAIIEYRHPKPSDYLFLKVPDVWGTNENTPNSSPQAIEPNPSCSGQAHSKGPSTGPKNENTEYGCILEVIRALFMIRPLSRADV